jgi:hypothetical protein
LCGAATLHTNTALSAATLATAHEALLVPGARRIMDALVLAAASTVTATDSDAMSPSRHRVMGPVGVTTARSPLGP